MWSWRRSSSYGLRVCSTERSYSSHTSEPGANDPAVRVVDSSHSSSSTGINWILVLALLVIALFWLDVALAVAAAV